MLILVLLLAPHPAASTLKAGVRCCGKQVLLDAVAGDSKGPQENNVMEEQNIGLWSLKGTWLVLLLKIVACGGRSPAPRMFQSRHW